MSDAGKNLSKDYHSDCGVCRFWKRSDVAEGRCLRYAPSPAPSSVPPGRQWPLTNATDVCGEFAVEVDP